MVREKDGKNMLSPSQKRQKAKEETREALKTALANLARATRIMKEKEAKHHAPPRSGVHALNARTSATSGEEKGASEGGETSSDAPVPAGAVSPEEE